MFKYYMRLKTTIMKMEFRNQILIASFLEDVKLSNSGVKENWQGQVDKIKKTLKLPSLDISDSTFSSCWKNFYIKNVNMQLQNIETW